MREDTVWGNIFRKNEHKEESIFSVLKKIPIFRNLNNREIKAVERILHRRTYQEGEVLFTEGEPGVGMYIIESGTVYITLGKEKKTLAVLSKGDFFGEMALLLESARTATALAGSPVRILGFFQPDLFHLLETQPRTGNKILMHLAQMMAERLRQTSLENRELKLKISQYQAEKDK